MLLSHIPFWFLCGFRQVKHRELNVAPTWTHNEITGDYGTETYKSVGHTIHNIH
jgi:hypothetical protein